MCRPASFVMTESNVYWSKSTDSHEDIIKEFSLVDAEPIRLLRVEIVPEDGDLRTPVEKWKFRVDQDLIPHWYDADKDGAEARCRAELAKWHGMKIIIDRTAVVTGNAWVYGSSHVEARGSSHVEARGSSHVEAWGSSHVVAWGSSHVEAWESSSVVAWESSSVVAWESSHVEAWESSSVVAWESSNILCYGGKYELHDTAACIDRSGPKVKMVTAKKPAKKRIKK